jgi:geranylgeranyl pyrophosphate synthase
MQCFSEYGADLITLTNAIGLYYQIRDDYINLSSEKVRMLNESSQILDFVVVCIL